MQEPKAKIELFLSDLAVNGQVAAATQNQALNALVFLVRERSWVEHGHGCAGRSNANIQLSIKDVVSADGCPRLREKGKVNGILNIGC